MQKELLTIKPTLDGSYTIFNQEIGEAYHSMNGAFQESEHVFLKNGLIEFLNRTKKTEVQVLEIGFGTGLNFLCCTEYCIKNSISMNYTGVDNHLPSLEMLSLLDYKPLFPISFPKLIETINNESRKEKENIVLKIIQDSVQNIDFKEKYDLVFYDAFAPASQPEMWEENIICKIAKTLKDDGFFISYSITGKIKTILRNEGFKIERPEGANGKRQMLRAVKLKNNYV